MFSNSHNTPLSLHRRQGHDSGPSHRAEHHKQAKATVSSSRRGDWPTTP